ncbi:hypothetical protein [Paenibacillus sp. SN-8-1]|uniref:hypothetical protein n=1 Tax=Paenibacillus sp. SN-8-1 TaxID=3435409 RepID=UPI003D9A7A93
MSNNKEYDFKTSHVMGFAKIVESLKTGQIDKISIPEGSSFAILTHSAIITAELYNLYPDTEGEDGEFKFDSDDAQRLIVKTIHEGVSDKANENSGTFPIYLQNAVIKSFSNPSNEFKLAFLCLYSDQVLGVTFGKFQMN